MINNLFFLLLISLVVFFLPPCILCQQQYVYDLIIYAATPGGIAAAISASRYATSLHIPFTIAIVESSSYIGGMSAAGGIGLRDIGVEDTLEYTIAAQWCRLNAAYYNSSDRVYQPDMFIATQSFNQMLKEENITVYTHQAIDSVDKRGDGMIESFTSITGIEYIARIFIDASYEGDLMIRANISWTYGRESRNQYSETDAGVMKYTTFSNFLSQYPVNATVTSQDPTLIPYVDSAPLLPLGSMDNRMMGYSYRLCVTTNRSNAIPFYPPTYYDKNKFIMLSRYIDSLIANKQFPSGPPLNFLVDIFNYRNYPHGNKFDICDSSGSAFTSDAITLNTNYIISNYSKREEIQQQHKEYVLGMIYFLASDPGVPEYTRNSTQQYGLCADEWNENGHIPPQLYVREGARMINDHVITQNNLITGRCLDDSIALGSWGYDIHVVSRTAIWDSTHTRLIVNNEGQLVGSLPGNGSVYEIGYSAIVPRRNEAVNLFVTVCFAATHVAYSSLRVEPHFMLIGESVGIAAVIAAINKLAVQDVNVTTVQQVLAQRNVQIHYHTYACKQDAEADREKKEPHVVDE